MDQDAVVNIPLAGGWQLIEALVASGVRVEVAFWARVSDEERWVFYIATPAFDDHNGDPRPVYQLVYAILRDAPEWGLDPFVIRVVSPGDPAAQAAAELVKPRHRTGPLAGLNLKPFRGMTPFGWCSLGKVRVEGGWVYPPWEPGHQPVGQVVQP